MDEYKVIKALGALAHPVRLKVFRALVVTGPSGLTPGTMLEGLGIPATTLSFHLRELVSAGLVSVERSSRMLIYRAAYDHMKLVLDYLTENCCQGSGCGDLTVCAPKSVAARSKTKPCIGEPV
jgi:ArsR family transcriptional regulator, arsenate/arsenite/antimonite-responsive transcriptional repressor